MIKPRIIVTGATGKTGSVVLGSTSTDTTANCAAVPGGTAVCA